MKNMDYLMELIVMCVQVISKVFVFLLFFVGISFAQRDSIMAEYCVYLDTSKVKNMKNIIKFSAYEDRISLNITLDFRSHDFSKSLSADLLETEKKVKFVFPIFGGGGSSRPSPKKESISPYDFLDFYVPRDDSLYAISMFDKTYTLHWEFSFEIGLQKQKLVGNNMVYVSGFCTDEQLQVIRERKKNREEALTLW